jgi:hypothetical protein
MTCAWQGAYDHEGEAPEGTPLSCRLCTHLGLTVSELFYMIPVLQGDSNFSPQDMSLFFFF